jgi:hypothetical protein
MPRRSDAPSPRRALAAHARCALSLDAAADGAAAAALAAACCASCLIPFAASGVRARWRCDRHGEDICVYCAQDAPAPMAAALAAPSPPPPRLASHTAAYLHR